MRTRIVSVFMVLAVISLVLGLGGCDRKVAEVVAADKALDKAIDSGDGQTVVSMISQDSLARMDRLLDFARTAKKSEVKALPVADRLEVLQVRQELKSDVRKPMDARTYYARLVTNRRTESTSGAKRGKITFNAAKTEAKMLLTSPDGSDYMYGYWVYEGGGWKEDFVARVRDDAGRIQAAARELSMTEDEFLIFRLEESSEEAVPPSIWDAPR